MPDTKFDDLTKKVAAAQSRRDALKALVLSAGGLAIGGALGSLIPKPAPAEAAPSAQKKKKGSPSICSTLLEYCETFPEDFHPCCPNQNLQCVQGRCCIPPGGQCQTDAQCCPPFVGSCLGGVCLQAG
jgi:hypothetical protein